MEPGSLHFCSAPKCCCCCCFTDPVLNNEALERARANFFCRGPDGLGLRPCQDCSACPCSSKAATRSKWQGCVPVKLYLQKEARFGPQAELARPLFCDPSWSRCLRVYILWRVSPSLAPFFHLPTFLHHGSAQVSPSPRPLPKALLCFSIIHLSLPSRRYGGTSSVLSGVLVSQ